MRVGRLFGSFLAENAVYGVLPFGPGKFSLFVAAAFSARSSPKTLSTVSYRSVPASFRCLWRPPFRLVPRRKRCLRCPTVRSRQVFAVCGGRLAEKRFRLVPRRKRCLRCPTVRSRQVFAVCGGRLFGSFLAENAVYGVLPFGPGKFSLFVAAAAFSARSSPKTLSTVSYRSVPASFRCLWRPPFRLVPRRKRCLRCPTVRSRQVFAVCGGRLFGSFLAENAVYGVLPVLRARPVLVVEHVRSVSECMHIG